MERMPVLSTDRSERANNGNKHVGSVLKGTRKRLRQRRGVGAEIQRYEGERVWRTAAAAYAKVLRQERTAEEQRKDHGGTAPGGVRGE